MKNGPYRIAVFQQNGSGLKKIAGIDRFGAGEITLEIVSIDTPLPPVIEDGRSYLPQTISADLVLDYLRHPDLSADLATLCQSLGIPIVASGKKHRHPNVFIPPTCCGLTKNERLGRYGERFGAPEYTVRIEEGKIQQIQVVRGAPCGATWDAIKGVIGLEPETAIVRIGLEVQFFCVADPAGWDPIYGKSPVHFAGNIHSKALEKAIRDTCGS